MISVNDLKVGLTFKHSGEIYQVLEFQHSKTARSQANVKTKLKNLRTHANVSITFSGGEKLENAFIDRKKIQYLYNDGSSCIFMDNETYEQIEIPINKLKWELNFLKESENIDIMTYNNEILGVHLPTRINLKIVEAEDAVKGNSTSNPQKKAKLESGYEIMVPIFIKAGETIIVDTESGKYISRAK